MSDNKPAPAVRVTPTDAADTYDVEVAARSTTRHRVTISPAYLRELGLPATPAAEVLQAAFHFLLEREPNTSILRRFDLCEIERYFPEFRAEIAAQVRR